MGKRVILTGLTLVILSVFVVGTGFCADVWRWTPGRDIRYTKVLDSGKIFVYGSYSSYEYYGILNPDNTWAVNPTGWSNGYSDMNVKTLSNGKLLFQSGSTYGILNHSGTWAVSPRAWSSSLQVTNLSGGKMLFIGGSSYGIMNSNCSWAVSPSTFYRYGTNDALSIARTKVLSDGSILLVGTDYDDDDVRLYCNVLKPDGSMLFTSAQYIGTVRDYSYSSSKSINITEMSSQRVVVSGLGSSYARLGVLGFNGTTWYWEEEPDTHSTMTGIQTISDNYIVISCSYWNGGRVAGLRRSGSSWSYQSISGWSAEVDVSGTDRSNFVRNLVKLPDGRIFVVGGYQYGILKLNTYNNAVWDKVPTDYSQFNSDYSGWNTYLNVNLSSSKILVYGTNGYGILNSNGTWNVELRQWPNSSNGEKKCVKLDGGKLLITGSTGSDRRYDYGIMNTDGTWQASLTNWPEGYSYYETETLYTRTLSSGMVVMKKNTYNSYYYAILKGDGTWAVSPRQWVAGNRLTGFDEASLQRLIIYGGTGYGILNADGTWLKSPVVFPGGNAVNTWTELSDKSIMFGGQNGYYCVIDAYGDTTVEPKGWDVSYTISGSTTSGAIFTMVQLMDDEKVLAAGKDGYYQFLTFEEIGIDTGDGTWEGAPLPPMPAVTMKANGYMVVSNRLDYIQVIDPEGNLHEDPITGSEYKQTWGHTGLNILALVTRPDDSVLMAGEKGAFQLRRTDGTLVKKADGSLPDVNKWVHTGVDIITLQVVPNGNVLMVGEGGYYQLLKITGSHPNYTLQLGGSGRFAGVGSTVSALPRPDGRIVLVSNRGFGYYKLDNDYDISLKEARPSEVVLNTKWEGQGFANAKLVITDENGSVREQDFSGATVTAASLNVGKKYTFMVKSQMNYPISFMSRPVEVTTTLPIEIADFTDRVTGANRWMTDAEAQDLNLYTPDSEIVSRVILDPKGCGVNEYVVDFDTNLDNEKIETYDISVAKMEAEGEVIAVPEVEQVDSQIIRLTVNPASDQRDKKITVYVKYKFRKLNPDDKLVQLGKDSFTNRISVRATTVDADSVNLNKTNTILIRDTKIYYM